MPSFTGTDIQDLVKGSQRELGKLRFQQIAQDLTRFEIFTKWFKKDKLTVSEGIGIQRNLMTRYQHTARHVGWNDEDRTSVADVMEQLQVNWRYMTDSWGFNYYETLQNKGQALIFDVFKPRRLSCMLSIASELESKAWSCPTASNTTDPYGIPYWLVPNATEGFNGGLPSDHTTIAGVNLTSQAPNFKNYTFTYSAVSKLGLIKKLRKMYRLTDFQAPISNEDYRTKTGQRFRHYCNETTISDIEDIGEAQNENLGRDVATMDGQMVLRSNPLVYVPQLDSDTTNPIASIDHSTFMPIVLKGAVLIEHDAIQSATNHLWYYIPVDLAYNYMCIDRRRNSWCYYVAP